MIGRQKNFFALHKTKIHSIKVPVEQFRIYYRLLENNAKTLIQTAIKINSSILYESKLATTINYLHRFSSMINLSGCYYRSVLTLIRFATGQHGIQLKHRQHHQCLQSDSSMEIYNKFSQEKNDVQRKDLWQNLYSLFADRKMTKKVLLEAVQKHFNQIIILDAFMLQKGGLQTYCECVHS